MGIETENSEKYIMHKKGDFFIAKDQIHVLEDVQLGFTPADSECEEYTAICGLESQSWSMPSQGVSEAYFIPSLIDIENRNLKKCNTCFASESKDPVDITLQKLVNNNKYNLTIEGVSENDLNLSDFSRFNIPSEKGDRCIWTIENSFDKDPKDRKHIYEIFLFKKSDLKNAIKNAINSQQISQLPGKKIYAEYHWDWGNVYKKIDNPEVSDTVINLKFDKLNNDQHIDINLEINSSQKANSNIPLENEPINKIPRWQETFICICEEMKISGETVRPFPERGEVNWYEKDHKCSNCGHEGMFSGFELEYGGFYECARASYCANCNTVSDLTYGVNFAVYDGERFLPVMKKKLIENSNLRECCVLDSPCPVCKGETFTFQKDLGAIDFYDYSWTVCINKDCHWSGIHDEQYEHGPY